MDLWKLTHIKELLEKHHLWAKKRFGQNFLINKDILYIIVNAASIEKTDHIIEVGPGLGVLTRELCKKAQKVTSIELDRNLLPVLEETLAEFQNYEIINADALKFTPPSTPYKVVANIPYNISSPLLSHFLQSQNPPTTMTILIQKEVAEKICDREKHSVLSLQVQLFADPKIIKKVRPSAFHPAPKVDSAILHLKVAPKTKNGLKIIKIAKTGFSQKRKKLLTTLRKALKNDQLPQIFKKIGLSENIRPERLSIQDWENLAQELD